MKNQNKYIFNLYRQAVGTDWQRYRPQYEWFNIDSVLSGSNQRWKELELMNPSLKRFLYSATISYNDYIEKFQERYNVDESMIKQFYTMYVGYHPAYGAYSVGVGPYVGEKQADGENKFGYFTQRYPSTDSKSVINLIKDYSSRRNGKIKPLIDHLGLTNLLSVVEPEDFTLNIWHKKSAQKSKQGETFDFVDVNKDFLEKNDYQKAIQESREPVIRPVLGLASKLQMKPSGIMKVLKQLAKRDGQVDELKNIIDVIGDQMRISPDDRMNEAYSNMGYAKRIMNEFKSINPFLTLEIGEPRVAGSQREQSFGTDPEQISRAKLMAEICFTIDKISSEDPYLVAQALNSKSKKRAAGTFNAESVKYWIESIQPFRDIKDENGNVVGTMSYAEASQFFMESSEALDTKHDNPAAGFDDIETALKFACLRAAESKSDEIDPVTGAKINVIPPVLEKTYQQNITSRDLTKLRNGEEIEWDKKELVRDEESIGADDELDNLEDAEIEDVDFIDEPEIEDIEDINVVKEPVKSIPEPMPESIPEPINEPIIDSIPKPMPRLRVPRKNANPKPTPINNVDKALIPENQEAEVMAKIINKLQILSQDLNKKGFDKVSSNINQIINKYKRF
jgi:hypothetical protein